MGIRQEADELMRHMRVTEEMHQAIMEGRKMKNQNKFSKFSIKKAAVPAAAAFLIGSTMYVGAGYIMEQFPLREIFAQEGNNLMNVPESQKMPEIYGEVADPVNTASTGLPGDGSSIAESKTQIPMGKYGEMIIDNELFSIELLEKVCTGRELSLSYILTYKTEEMMPVDVVVEGDYYGELLDGPSDAAADSSRLLLENGFGDSLDSEHLPDDCIYELAENQRLCNFTQLAKEEYRSGMYQLYAEYFTGADEIVEYTAGADTGIHASGSNTAGAELNPAGSKTGHTYFKAPIEIISNDNYGLALSGTTDKTEGDVHFDAYEVYVSPWNVYLSLEGTYKGEMSAIWGAKSSHEITIGFKDGTTACTTVLLSGMGYGFGEIDVNMRASFDTAIDPEAIASVTLDGVVIMGE